MSSSPCAVSDIAVMLASDRVLGAPLKYAVAIPQESGPLQPDPQAPIRGRRQSQHVRDLKVPGRVADEDEIPAIEAHQAGLHPDPKIAVRRLCDGIDRPARKALLGAPTVHECIATSRGLDPWRGREIWSSTEQRPARAKNPACESWSRKVLKFLNYHLDRVLQRVAFHWRTGTGSSGPLLRPAKAHPM